MVFNRLKIGEKSIRWEPLILMIQDIAFPFSLLLDFVFRDGTLREWKFQNTTPSRSLKALVAISRLSLRRGHSR